MAERYQERDDRDDEPTIPEQSKNQTENSEKICQEFIDTLKTLRESMERAFRAERPKNSKEVKVFEGVPTEIIKEREREGRESSSEKTWERIKSEGINQNTLKEFLDNVEIFSKAELEVMIASIDDLLREWDPALHGFLRNLQSELRAMAQLKETKQE